MHIDPSLEALVPRPSQEELEALKESIKRDGQREAIVVSQDGIIVDGCSRYSILKGLEKPIRFEVRNFPTREDMETFTVDAALLRRNMNKFQRIKTSQPLLKKEQERAQARQKLGKQSTAISESNDTKGRAIALVAKRYGVSPTTYWRGLQILEHGTPEQIAKLEQDEASINGIYKQLEKNESLSDLDRTPEITELPPLFRERAGAGLSVFKRSEQTKVESADAKPLEVDNIRCVIYVEFTEDSEPKGIELWEASLDS